MIKNIKKYVYICFNMNFTNQYVVEKIARNTKIMKNL